MSTNNSIFKPEDALTWLNPKDERRCNLVWERLKQHHFLSPHQLNAVDHLQRHSIIIEVISNLRHTQPNHIKYALDLHKHCKESLLEKSELTWIKSNDERLCIWVYHHINNAGIGPIHLNLISNQDRYKQIIFKIDIWQAHIEIKKQFLNDMKMFWSKHIESDKKRYNWLNSKDALQCDWAWGYLNELPFSLKYLCPTNPSEKYGAAISSMDCWNAAHPAEKELFINKMKSSWRAQKHREKTREKKQCNFTLSTDVKDKLDALAKTHKISKNKLIGYLIEKEHEYLELP